MNPEKHLSNPASGFSRWMAAALVLCLALVHPLAAAFLRAGPGGQRAWVAYASAPAPREDGWALSDVHYTVDFERLHKVNPEIRGWLLQKGGPINDPVVQGPDNDFYQTHLFTQKYDLVGALYLDSANDGAFGDRITWLYGNCQEEGAIFASLPRYLEQAYAEDYPSFFLLTPSGDYQVDIFASVVDGAEQGERWALRPWGSRGDFEAYVGEIRKASAIQTQISVQWGDRLLALCAGAPDAKGDRPIVFGKLRPLSYASDKPLDVTKMKMDALEGVSKKVYIPGRGVMRYYAQNDPIWTRMRYEAINSNKSRHFGQGGCAPTAVAMALANVATDQQLEMLTAFTRKENGFTFCPCSVNQFYCSGRHLRYKIETAQEMRRYLPVAVASFASGNNLWNHKSRGRGYGTGPHFIQMIADICQLKFSAARSLNDALDTLAAGGIAVVTTTGRDSPFTGGDHYLVLAHADEEYLYFLDSFLKGDYSRTDRRGLLTVLEPGVVRANRADIKKLLLYSYYLLQQP